MPSMYATKGHAHSKGLHLIHQLPGAWHTVPTQYGGMWACIIAHDVAPVAIEQVNPQRYDASVLLDCGTKFTVSAPSVAEVYLLAIRRLSQTAAQAHAAHAALQGGPT